MMRGGLWIALTMALPTAATSAPVGPAADRLLSEAVQARGAGATAVIAERGEIVWTGAVGKASVTNGSALKADSLFRYASITKQFTAALVLLLVEEGRLSLDDQVGKLLAAETPAAWHKVTVRQLLNHTSGIPSYTGAPGFMMETVTSRAHSTQQLIDITREQAMDFVPGTDWRYNNTGYILLEAIIQKQTGKTWHAALRERITGPLGLSTIRCGCEAGPAVVAGHRQDGSPPQAIDMSVPGAAGALVGNVADLGRWAAALHGGRVLKPASYQAMIAPTVLSSGRTVPYGFGLGSGSVRGLPTLEHSGGIFGFVTDSLYVPERQLFVAALSNSEGGDASSLARRLLAQAAGRPFPVMTARPADVKALAPFFGVYRDAEGERRFFERGGKLYTQRSGGSRFEVHSAGSDRFFYGGASLSYFDLGRSADGKPQMTFHPNGAMDGVVGRWTGPVPPEAPAVILEGAQLDHLAGRYALGPAIMTIARSGEGLTGQLTGQSAIPLEAMGPLEFRTVGVDARLVFEEEGGRVVRVVLHQGGRAMPFQRQ